MENTNPNSILNDSSPYEVPGNTQQASMSPVEQPLPETSNPSAISSLSDIHPIPEFQAKSNKNKLVAIGLVVLGVIILGATATYYMMRNTTEENPVADDTMMMQEPVDAGEVTTAKETQPQNVVDQDPVINEINKSIDQTDSENIEETAKELKDFDFENMDLELQQNPGL